MHVSLPRMPQPRLLTQGPKPSPTAATTKGGTYLIAGQTRSSEPLGASPTDAMVIRAEAMTSILKEILRSRPTLHWGIND